METLTQVCKRYDKCPVFNDMLSIDHSAEAYRQQFCYTNCTECKRYHVAEKCGTCPEKVMPNSFLSVDEIIGEMKKRGVLN